MKQFLKIVFGSMVGFILANTLIFFSSFFVIGILIATLGESTMTKEDGDKGESKILKIEFDGPLVERMRHRELYFGDDSDFLIDRSPLGLYELRAALKQAQDDDEVKGVYIDSGFASSGWAMLTELRNDLLDFKKSGKFIYSYSSVYSEPNYYVASVADVVFIYPQGYIEFDGFASVPSFYKGTLDKLEVEPLIFRAGAFKSAVEPFFRENLSDENRLQMTELVGGLWKNFISEIAESRGATVDRLQEIAEGRWVSSAEQAKEFGLVDELKFEDEVLEFLRGAVGVEKDEKIPFVSTRKYLNKKRKASAKELFDFKAGDEEEESLLAGPGLAVVFAEGEIVGGSSSEGTMGSATIVKSIRKARKDKNIKALVLRVNSPGGSALASDEIWREVSLAADKMPVIASFSDVAASGGYYIASAAKEIFAEESTITGSIGVFGMSFMLKDFFNNKLGVTFDRVVSSRFADLGSPVREMDADETAQINKEIDRIYERFLSLVERGRSMERDQLMDVAEGRVWSGSAALENGLVDKIGGLKAAMFRAAELAKLPADHEIVTLPRPDHPIKLVFDLMSTRLRHWLDSEKLVLTEARKMMGLPRAGDPRNAYMMMPYRIEIN